MKEEYEKERKQVTEATPSVPAVPLTDTINETITIEQQPMTVPNPSDEATPSTATPRNGSESVEQLHSSLRAVADALAQTVAEVRNARRLLGGTGEEGSGGGGGTENRPDSSEDNYLTTPPMSDSTTVSRSVASMPDLSSFDGSQDSARAMLSRISSDDPLFTFLSAVARAPTPPLPESVSEPSNIATATPPLPTSSSVPRLPVFTRFVPTQLLPHDLNELPVATIPVATIPVIQYPHRISTSAATVTFRGTSNPQTHSSQAHSQSEDSVSQSLDAIPSQTSQSNLSASNFADVLATELARAVSDHLATTSSNHLLPHSSSVSFSVPSVSVTITGSPSPSDTLAPLMSSLQMPPRTTQASPEAAFSTTQTNSITTTISPTEGQSTSTEGRGCSLTLSSQEQPMLTDTPSLGGGVMSSAIMSEGQGLVASGESSTSDGIDPTFLAALPDSIRQEVIVQYEREQQRNRQSTSTSSAGATATTTTSTTGVATLIQSQHMINPEVLAALPPDIQEEVCDIGT